MVQKFVHQIFKKKEYHRIEIEMHNRLFEIDKKIKTGTVSGMEINLFLFC